MEGTILRCARAHIKFYEKLYILYKKNAEILALKNELREKNEKLNVENNKLIC